MKKVLLFLSLLAPSLAAQPRSHAALDALLKEHVNAAGMVDYRKLKTNAARLDAYLALLGRQTPQSAWPAADRLAYWLNAYNAFTLRLVLDHYPIASIKDITTGPNIPMINTPWTRKFIRLGQQTYSLDEIEHDIVRRQFNEPRIHFALVCAARSCPPLRAEAYVGSRLSAQLEEQARRFFNDPAKNDLQGTPPRLSKIMDWYGGDFSKEGQSVLKWVNRYAVRPLPPHTRFAYLAYDWGLNSQP